MQNSHDAPALEPRGSDPAADRPVADPLDTPLVCHTYPKVVLVGPPGAGKSTIGRRLARALSLPLVDSDQLLEQDRAQPCGEIFAGLGEARFREVEAEAVARALTSGGVVSLGGGAVLTESTRVLLEQHPVVWIDVSPEEGYQRTRGDDSRPVLAAEDPAAHYRQLLTDREAYYRSVADYRVRSDGKSPQGIVADILGFLETL